MSDNNNKNDENTGSSNSNRRRKRNRLIIDTDVGMDDLVAIGALALVHQHPRDGGVEIALVTTVCGSSSAHFAKRVLETIFPKSSFPVVAGVEEEEPPPNLPWVLDSRQEIQKFFFGITNTTTTMTTTTILSESETKSNENNSRQDENAAAASAILELFRNSPPEEQFDLLCLGPLSNVAQLVAACQEENEDKDVSLLSFVKSKLGSIHVMGGSSSQEIEDFNFGLDKDSAVTFLTTLHDKIWLLTAEHSDAKQVLPEWLHTEFQNILQQEEEQQQPDNKPKNMFCKIWSSHSWMLGWDILSSYTYLYPNQAVSKPSQIAIDPITAKLTIFKDDNNSNNEEQNPNAFSVNLIQDISLDDRHYFYWLVGLVRYHSNQEK